MRKIKFRIWDKDLKHLFLIGPDKDITDDEKICDWNFLFDAYKSIVIMQFTGLKDKNGKDIYEGDVVATSATAQKSKRKIVRWNEKKAGWNIHPDQEWKRTGVMHSTHLQIIGNIYTTV